MYVVCTFDLPRSNIKDPFPSPHPQTPHKHYLLFNATLNLLGLFLANLVQNSGEMNYI